MTLLNFFKRHWKLARLVVELKAENKELEHSNRGLRGHITRMKREHDEKLIGLIASKEIV